MKRLIDYGIDIGTKTGTEVKIACPKCSHLRKKKSYPCLNVNADKGVWNCWHCGWSGGISHGEYNAPTISKQKLYVKPEHRPSMLTDLALGFFDQRRITHEVIARNRIATEKIWMPQIEDESNCIAFPYLRNGDVVNVKYRDGAKNFRQVAGAEKILYKYDDIDDECTIITEGELDALALEVAGFKNAVSVPDGAPSPTAKTFDTKFEFLEDERLDRVKRFVIAVDNDEPGKKLEEELSRRLGRERCAKVVWMHGCKDANEVLIQFGAQILKDCIDNATPYPVEGVFSVMDIADDLQQLLDNGLPQGEPTGWKDVDALYTPAAGQWTLVTGIPSMGKSEWLDALLINIAESAGWVFGICSPENHPIHWHTAKLLEKRMEKRFKPGQVSEQEFNEAKLWLHEHFHFIVPSEAPTFDSVLEKAKALVRRHGLKGLIIDPYNELDHTRRREGINETEYVSAFLTQLRTFARQQSIHIWLVAHPAKLFKDKDGTYPVPDGYSVSGSAHFYNKADNIIVIHRDLQTPMAHTQVHVQKVRSRWLGSRGVAQLRWRSDCGRFADVVDVPSHWEVYGKAVHEN